VSLAAAFDLRFGFGAETGTGCRSRCNRFTMRSSASSTALFMAVVIFLSSSCSSDREDVVGVIVIGTFLSLTFRSISLETLAMNDVMRSGVVVVVDDAFVMCATGTQ
jgi:hypothetical protein